MSYIICIFLCAVFSARGQEIKGYDPLERALQWEREVYGSGDPSSVHSALRSKAACYEEASCFEDALRTLDRIRLYLLSPEEQSEVLLSKARCCINTGDAGAALGYLEESGRADDYPDIYSVLLASSWRFSESREKALEFAGEDEIHREAVVNIFKKAPRPRKEGTATFLSFFPPAGQIYLGEPLRGIGSMLLNAGAAGFTSGLTYFPGKFADTSELTALSEVLKDTEKIYATHMRSEGDSLMEAVEEAITIARAGSDRLQISHLKTIFPRNFNKIGQLLARLEQCRIEGMFLHADRYPYVYSSTRIGQILPGPYDKDTEIKARLAGSESFRQEIIEALRHSPRDLASTILMKNGKTLSQLAEENGWTLEETGMQVLMENPEQTAAYLCMSEENMMKILAEPWVCAGSDAISAQLDDPASQGHPRAVGTFPTFFRKVASITSMQEAVRRMTSLPASIFRIPKRGVIQKGYFADLVVLDPERYESKAGFNGCDLQPLGVSLVMVNGEIAWDAAKPDRIIRAGRFLPVD